MALDSLFQREGVPEFDRREELDVRDLKPPEPLQETMDRLTEMEDGAVLVQINDRVPQHLFPILQDRGFAYETLEDDPVYTLIWPE
ncbi:MAG: DUF2249 domain-containing protein [Halodesulfurarchaeum sp.]